MNSYSEVTLIATNTTGSDDISYKHNHGSSDTLLPAAGVKKFDHSVGTIPTHGCKEAYHIIGINQLHK